MSEEKKSKVSGNIFKIVIIVFLALILVGGAAFGGYYFASKDNPASAGKAAKTESIEEATVEAGEFLINLADEDSKRYLKTKIVLTYDSKNKKLAKEVAAKNHVIRDSIINVIRGKKAADISLKGTEDLKKEILNRVNPAFETGKLVNVYFYDILVQ
jgi:flagellar basal body-associated protein FliL